jgi:uncharacterized membrane protein YdfJ with MMPL/SSD domain
LYATIVLLIKLWTASVVNGARSESVAASYLITLLRQQSDYSSGTHKFIPLRTQSVLYGCGKDSFHLTSIPNILANWRLALVDRFMGSL